MTGLQITWFVLVGVLLTGYAVLAGFDLGVGFWHLFNKKDEDRTTLLRAIGPVWDGNEVWLLTGGGALFAAFPPVYAAVFSGFYLALLLVLLSLVLRVVAIEFRGLVETPGWRKWWDIAFAAGSTIPAILFGVALGNLVRGLEMNASGNYVGGFFALLNPYALWIGLTGLAMLAVHGALYVAIKTEGELRERARVWVSKAWLAYLPLFLVSALWSLGAHQRGSIALPAVFAVLALVAIGGTELFNRSGAIMKAFLSSSLGIAALMGGAGATLFPNLVPAANDPTLSLTAYNASSSQYTLTIMLILALLGMPLVIGYTIYIYRIFAGPVRTGDGHY